jgi:DNA polymerase III epsilon subunit-like protein
MKIFLPQVKEQLIILFDIEYDNSSLVQLAFLILTRTTEPNIYVLSKSVNLYVKQGQPLNPFFTRYTHITDDFLCDNGMDLSVARAFVMDNLLDVDVNNCLLVSHGVKNDVDILRRNDFALSKIKNHYCTYNMARKLLKRNSKLGLADVAAEDGYFMFDAHNAYADVWGTLHAFCFLQNISVGGK